MPERSALSAKTGLAALSRNWRYRALLDRAAECEREAWDAGGDPVRALYEEALHARAAALVLEAEARL